MDQHFDWDNVVKALINPDGHNFCEDCGRYMSDRTRDTLDGTCPDCGGGTTVTLPLRRNRPQLPSRALFDRCTPPPPTDFDGPLDV